jgi:hypothetical protein
VAQEQIDAGWFTAPNLAALKKGEEHHVITSKSVGSSSTIKATHDQLRVDGEHRCGEFLSQRIRH